MTGKRESARAKPMAMASPGVFMHTRERACDGDEPDFLSGRHVAAVIPVSCITTRRRRQAGGSRKG